MFSGIVEEIGTVVSLERKRVRLWDGSEGIALVLVVRCHVVLEGATVGCSIAVNGTCLTVTEFTESSFTVCIAPETEDKTTFGALRAGARVNLERSLPVSARNSGHYVQGHVDGRGTVLQRWMDGSALWFRIRVPEPILRGVVPKGYVAIDGTSLTVVSVDRSSPTESATGHSFTIMLVPHTQSAVVFPDRKVGDDVNIEVDVMGKYAVERSVPSAPLPEFQGTGLATVAATALVAGFLGGLVAASLLLRRHTHHQSPQS